jgi:hypothetical protein
VNDLFTLAVLCNPIINPISSYKIIDILIVNFGKKLWNTMSLIEGMKILDNLSFNQNLKPDNILLDSKMIHKIIEFDSAWIINRTF